MPCRCAARGFRVGRTYWQGSNFDQAREIAESVIVHAQELDNPFETATAYITLGNVNRTQGEVVAAQDNFEQALALYRQPA